MSYIDTFGIRLTYGKALDIVIPYNKCFFIEDALSINRVTYKANKSKSHLINLIFRYVDGSYYTIEQFPCNYKEGAILIDRIYAFLKNFRDSNIHHENFVYNPEELRRGGIKWI